MRYQPISEAEVIPEFFLIQLCAVKVMGHSAKPQPVSHFHMEVITLLASHHLLLSIHIYHINVLSLFTCTHASLTYTSPVTYVVEGSTS